MSKLKVSLYPNGELRAVLIRERGVRWSSRDRDNGSEFPMELDDSGEVDDSGGEPPSPLDNRSKLSEGPKPGYGGVPSPTSFGNNARRTLSRAAGVFEVRGIAPSECLFLTGTLPGGSKESFDAMAKWSSWVVKRVKTFISDCGVLAGLSMYCWEFQRRGALHLHYLVHVPCPETLTMIKGRWRSFWSNLIDGVGSRSSCDMWDRGNGTSWTNNKGVIQADAQVVVKSVGRYLAKYLGKQAPRATGRGKGGEVFLGPVRWWSVSRPLLALLREMTEEFEVSDISVTESRGVANRIYRVIKDQCDLCYSYEDDSRSCLVIIGYGKVSTSRAFNLLYRDLYHGIKLNAFDY